LMGGPGSLSYLNLPIPRRLSPFQNMTEAASGPIYCHFKHAIDLSSQPLPQSTVVVGSLKYGASQDPVYGLFDGRKNDLSETRYGSGRVYLIGCDLFSNTVKMRKDYGNLFGGLLYFIGISPPKVDSDDSNSNNSQDMKLFHVTLPSAAVVSVIFLLYFLVAIPGTYLILKKKQRLELAWAAIPIISIVFALSFQVYAINLYKQGLSHFTTGALALANGETDGYFTGQTEIYFPKGGQYDIAVPGAEMLEEKGEDQLRTSILETYDTTAGIAALSYPVTNLSFRNFSYSCPVFLSGPITGRIALENGRLIGTITNKSGWRLAGARLVLAQWSDISAEEVKNPSETLPKKGQEGVRQSSIVLDDILPGETKNLSEALPNKMRSPDEVVLSASIPEEAVGPQIGKSVAQNGGSNISMYIPIIKEGAKK
jgi:heme/copper-type cytochrome/quinol oxidase subunit 2